MHISIMYEDENFIVCDKPADLPSVPLNVDDTKETALSQMIALCPAILSVKGKKEFEYGLVHRIDTATRGLLLAAKNQKAFDSIQKDQAKGTFVKYYTAFCISSSFRKPPFSISSKFRSFGPHNKMVNPVTETSGRAALKKAGIKIYTTEVLEITELKTNLSKSLTTPVLRVKCRITEGYRHQVRAHLASNGLPIIGDKLYGKSIKTLPMFFFATGLEFESSNRACVTLPEQSFLPDIF